MISGEVIWTISCHPRDLSVDGRKLEVSSGKRKFLKVLKNVISSEVDNDNLSEIPIFDFRII